MRKLTQADEPVGTNTLAARGAEKSNCANASARQGVVTRSSRTFSHSVHTGLRAFAPLLSLLLLLSIPAIAHAAPTQADVFKSIQNSMGGDSGSGTGGSAAADGGGGEVDYKRFLPYALAAAAVAILAILLSQRQQPRSPSAAKSLNHHGKLLKEIGKLMQLRSAELRQLKLLAEELEGELDDPSASPLTLLLCPSVMARSIAARKARGGRVTADRKLLAQLALKAGVTNEMLARAE